MNATRPYILSFLASCVLSLMTSVLVIIYSGTGLARDSGFPGGFVRDPDSGDLVPVSQVNLPARKAAMFVNLVLILLGELLIFLACSFDKIKIEIEIKLRFFFSSRCSRHPTFTTQCDHLLAWDLSVLQPNQAVGSPKEGCCHGGSGIPPPTPVRRRRGGCWGRVGKLVDGRTAKQYFLQVSSLY